MDYISAIGRLKSDVEQSKSLNTPLEAFMVDVGNMFTEVMRTNVDESGINAAFQLRQGLINEPYQESDSVGLSFFGLADYTDVRDKGISGTEVMRDTPYKFTATRPSREFAQSIDDWMRAKGFEANEWAVATNILKRGYEGAHFAAKTFSPENLDAFEAALLTLTEQYVTGQFTKIIPNLR